VKFLAESRDSGRRLALLAAAMTFAMLAVLAIAARARATETIYWDNYSASPESISFANIDGAGGGELPLAGTELNDPEGMAFDPANGRIYVANSGSSEITWVSIDGSGAGVLDTGLAPVEDPEGIAVDPKTQTVYWANAQTLGSIGYASANGGSGGSLNTAGAMIEDPYKIALDTTNGRVYWVNAGGTEGEVSYAYLNGTGGGNLNLPEIERPESWTAINVDPAAGRLYFLETAGEGYVYWVNLSGVGGGEVDLENSYWEGPYGMAFDPSIGRFYWANYGNGEEREGAFGTATLNPGGGGGITVATAPIDGPQDPVILKNPAGTGVPQVTQQVAALSCSQGSWSSDYPGSYVYGAPTSYGYQWLLNGQAIAGATADSLTATAAGSYTCSVTGKNVSGSASQTSPAVTVTAASLTAALQTKKPHAKAGKAAVVKLRLANGGDLSSTPVNVCAKLTKKAKKGLRAPKCASVGVLGNGGSATATLRVKTRKTAKGIYKLQLVVSGATVPPTKVSVKVTAGKKTHKKKHHG
jgi:DNA-binding beta-propeller fold protein YncE